VLIAAEGPVDRGSAARTFDQTQSMLAAANRAVATASSSGAPINIADAHILSNPAVNAGSITTSTDQGPDLSAGSYTLVVYCAGTGHITATLSVGKASTRLTAACQMLPMRLHLRPRRAGEATVTLAAMKRETIAVAYQLLSDPS
jgi:hypothetical protein